MSCCSSGGKCGGCKAILALVCLLVTVLTIAAAIGVYKSHVLPDGWDFGSLNGSLAILTLVVSVMAWLKLVKKLCPCGKGGLCSSGGCGGGSCGDGCGACGQSPCNCK